MSIQSRRTAGAAPLRVRRVVLYKNGMGFFEHLARVTGDETVPLRFTTAQLDDALKSLTVLDLGGGRVGSVTFGSTAPLAQRLRGVGLQLGEVVDRKAFLTALRGARLEVRAGTSVASGRLLAVEDRVVSSGTAGASSSAPVTSVSLVSDAGVVRSVALSGDAAIRLLDPDVSARVGDYLTAIGSEHGRDERQVMVSTAGSGTRDLYVSYTSEVPVWKATYRLLMPQGDRRTPILQGWAVVDNTTGEDWGDVELSLVAGAPQSFIQPLSQPRYGRRPVVDLPGGVEATPQVHGGAIATAAGTVQGTVRDPEGGLLPGATVTLRRPDGTVAATAVSDGQGRYLLTPPVGRYRLAVSLTGFVTWTAPLFDVVPGGVVSHEPLLRVGELQETVTVTGASPIVGAEEEDVMPETDAIAEAMAAVTPAASGQALGELFEYKLRDRVSIRRNQSALVPILQAEVTAERVSLWNPDVVGGRPLRAVWITNASGLTLDGGAMTIVDGGAFGGEGVIEPVKPGERRLVSYARDLGVLVDGVSAPLRERLGRVQATSGALIETRLSCARRTYTLRNGDATARDVIVEHPVRPGWRLAGGPAPVESTAAVHRYRVAVAPGATQTLVVDEVRQRESRLRLAETSARRLELIIREGAFDETTAARFRAVAERREALAAIDTSRLALDKQKETLTDDQERLRGNLGALKGSAEEKRLVQRYVAQLDAQEDQLADIDRKMAVLAGQRDEAQRALDAAAAALTLDVTPSAGAECTGGR